MEGGRPFIDRPMLFSYMLLALRIVIIKCLILLVCCDWLVECV